MTPQEVEEQLMNAAAAYRQVNGNEAAIKFLLLIAGFPEDRIEAQAAEIVAKYQSVLDSEK